MKDWKVCGRRVLGGSHEPREDDEVLTIEAETARDALVEARRAGLVRCFWVVEKGGQE